jgi:hypothetical protein
MTYQYELVSFHLIKLRLSEGWEPAPQLEVVYRYVNREITQTHVWLRRKFDV